MLGNEDSSYKKKNLWRSSPDIVITWSIGAVLLNLDLELGCKVYKIVGITHSNWLNPASSIPLASTKTRFSFISKS
jgi:hypothetical protein